MTEAKNQEGFSVTPEELEELEAYMEGVDEAITMFKKPPILPLYKGIPLKPVTKKKNKKIGGGSTSE